MLEEKEGADLPQSPASWTGRHREDGARWLGAGKKLLAEIADGVGGKGLKALAGYFM